MGIQLDIQTTGQNVEVFEPFRKMNLKNIGSQRLDGPCLADPNVCVSTLLLAASKITLSHPAVRSWFKFRARAPGAVYSDWPASPSMMFGRNL